MAEFRRDCLCVKVRDRCEFHTLHERVIIEEDAIKKKRKKERN